MKLQVIRMPAMSCNWSASPSIDTVAPLRTAFFRMLSGLFNRDSTCSIGV